MFFNSIDFAIFLPIVFVLYWLLNKSLKLQNGLIVLASYLFYGWWDWRFLSLILFSTLVDFTIGNQLGKKTNEKHRKWLLWLSLFVNLGFLAFFKYYNFFLDNFISAFSFFGQDMDVSRLDVILPVGISFYTFQTLSYTIDVYRKKLEPTKDIVAFTAFVSFFPQLVAGPIERATHLLPQFYVKRKFEYHKAVDGLRQILWGLFKKVVIADNCAEIANEIFNNFGDYNGSTLFVGAVFFALQIYGDFSGYSDIAIGTSRLFGFDLMKNFAFPYFSRDIGEFWRRWHISLSTWFRDYLYIPLGGSKGGVTKKIRNTFIIFVVSGFWHGANWTFIVWGALNAVYFLPLLLLNRNRSNIDVVAMGRYFPSVKEFFQILLTFSLTVAAWVFFRSENVMDALLFLREIFSVSFFTLPEILPVPLGVIILLFLVIEWVYRESQFGLQFDPEKSNVIVRWISYFIISFTIAMFFGKGSSFIYFQF